MQLLTLCDNLLHETYINMLLNAFNLILQDIQHLIVHYIYTDNVVALACVYKMSVKHYCTCCTFQLLLLSVYEAREWMLCYTSPPYSSYIKNWLQIIESWTGKTVADGMSNSSHIIHCALGTCIVITQSDL